MDSFFSVYVNTWGESPIIFNGVLLDKKHKIQDATEDIK